LNPNLEDRHLAKNLAKRGEVDVDKERPRRTENLKDDKVGVKDDKNNNKSIKDDKTIKTHYKNNTRPNKKLKYFQLN